jgi:hypothetical protein
MPITAQHAKSVTVADWSGVITIGNSTGGTTTDQATNLARPVDWNSVHNLTINLSASEVAGIFNFGSGLTSSTAAGGISVGIDEHEYWEPFTMDHVASTLAAPGIGTWYFQPMVLPFALNSGHLNFYVSHAAGFVNGTTISAASTGSNTISQTIRDCFAIYREGTGTASTRLESIWTGECSVLATWMRRVTTTVTSQITVSNYLSLSFPNQWDDSGGVTYGSTEQSGTLSVGASTMVSSSINSLITGAVAYMSGAQMRAIGLNTYLSAGNYWFAHMFTSSSASAGTNYTLGTAFSTQSYLGKSEYTMQNYTRLGTSVSNTTSTPIIYHGFLATTTSNASSVVASSNMRNIGTRVYFHYDNNLLS